MRKVVPQYEGPIDNFLLDVSESVSPQLKKWNFTPNQITTLSLVTGLASVEMLKERRLLGFGAFFMLSYFFDCLDGYYARRYNMVSEFGDVYDHVKDVAISGLALCVTLRHISAMGYSLVPVISILLVLFVLMYAELGCQQKLSTAQNSGDLLNHAAVLCPNEKQTVHALKYFAPGTFIAGVIALNLFYG